MEIAARIARHCLQERFVEASPKEKIKVILDQRGLSVTEWDEEPENTSHDQVLYVGEDPNARAVSGTVRDIRFELDVDVRAVQGEDEWKIIIS